MSQMLLALVIYYGHMVHDVIIEPSGDALSLDNFSIVGREDQNNARAIKEAILIRVNDPSLNRNIGKYQLQHIWDKVLVKSPELRLKEKPTTQGPGDPPDTHIAL